MAQRAAHTVHTEIATMSFELPFRAESAAIARQRLVDWLISLDAADGPHREDARLVLSELVGNAVRHARPLADGTMRVAWAATATAIDIAVTDGGAVTTPGRVNAGASALSGRGLAIVEILSSRWWVESSRSRTTVHDRARDARPDLTPSLRPWERSHASATARPPSRLPPRVP